MVKSKEHKKFLEWSLEAVVSKLAVSMPTSLVIAIKPSRMERQTFSCYDNFVKSNNIGVPCHVYDPELGAIHHLHNLLTCLEPIVKA